MRLLHITAGAGGMYCGSCLRDNALAAELLARGHDVSLLPLYTPTRTDEANRSGERVFFGGLSVYLQQRVPLLRRTPALLDVLWDMPAVIKAAAGHGVSVDPHALGEMTVSTLRGEDGFQAKEVRKLVRYLEGLPPFDVVLIPVSLLIGLAPPLKRALGRPVVCTLQGEDFFLEALGESHRRQAKDLIRAHAPHVDAFVATSDYYATFMAGYLGLDRSLVQTVPIGISLDGHDPAPRPRSSPLVLGYFARIAPEKGLHLLAEAYRILRRELGLPPSQLRAAGYLAPEHRRYLEEVTARLREWGLVSEFQYQGEVDRVGKIAFLRGLDVFSVPSPYAEPKGMYLLEAMANGVPWVQPRHGAFPEIHDKTGGGLLFTPHDTRELAARIFTLATDAPLAADLGRRGAAGVRAHYSAARMAERALEVYAEVVEGPAQPVRSAARG
ncbi:MAG TPA: glycosyltransferase family 4 protein [Vicinamibacteria bacterium]|nr:glycosyltransferase family 4 protein [Vicinamibacteria bacterium]